MDITINFYGKMRLMAIKIKDDLIKRMLAAEFESQNLSVPQLLPQFLFCWGHGMPQITGKPKQFRFCTTINGIILFSF